MGRAWLLERQTEMGAVRYEVRYRDKGKQKYGGRFATKTQALLRKTAIEESIASTPPSSMGEEEPVDVDGVLPEHAIAPAGFVYCFKGARGMFKVGWSSDPDRRLRQMQASVPYGLKIVRLDAASSRDAETALHRAFAKYRRHGEWFVLPDGWERTWALTVWHLECSRHACACACAPEAAS